MGVCKGYEGKTYVRPYKKALNDPGRVWSDNDKFFPESYLKECHADKS